MDNKDEILRLKAQASQFRARIAELENQLAEAATELAVKTAAINQLTEINEKNSKLQEINGNLTRQLDQLGKSLKEKEEQLESANNSEKALLNVNADLNIKINDLLRQLKNEKNKNLQLRTESDNKRIQLDKLHEEIRLNGKDTDIMIKALEEQKQHLAREYDTLKKKISEDPWDFLFPAMTHFNQDRK